MSWIIYKDNRSCVIKEKKPSTFIPKAFESSLRKRSAEDKALHKAPGERAELCSGVRARGQRSKRKQEARENPGSAGEHGWDFVITRGQKCRAT